MKIDDSNPGEPHRNFASWWIHLRGRGDNLLLSVARSFTLQRVGNNFNDGTIVKLKVYTDSCSESWGISLEDQPPLWRKLSRMRWRVPKQSNNASDFLSLAFAAGGIIYQFNLLKQFAINSTNAYDEYALGAGIWRGFVCPRKIVTRGRWLYPQDCGSITHGSFSGRVYWGVIERFYI